jgi:calcium/calmodulin-dependent protein kinase I
MNTFLTEEEEEELKIPGSFDMSNPRGKRRNGSADDEDDDDDEGLAAATAEGAEDPPWAALFRKMGLKA